MQGSYYFNLAQQAQKEGRWQDALGYIEEGHRYGCSWCTANLIDSCREEYWGKTLKEYWVRPSLSEKTILPSFPFIRFVNEMVRDKEQRLLRLRKSAENGNPVDQFYFGKEVLEESLDWFRKSANQLYFPAQNYLYDYFMTKEINYARAAYWYKQLPKNNRYVKTFLYNQDELFDGIGKCQKACYQVILIRKYRQSILSWIPKDVVVMIAKILWSTYEDVCWQERRSKRLRSKKKIKYSK